MNNNFFETIKEKISQFQISFTDEDSRKKILITVFGILIFLIILLILVLCFSGKEKVEVINQEYSITDYLYSPSSPEISDDYMYSRVPQKVWTEEEANKYITLPNSEMLENLKKANDKLIKDIMEVSPWKKM